MTLAILFSGIETNRLAMIVATATTIAALAIHIAQRCALITHYVIGTFGNCVIAQFVGSVLVLKAAVITNLAAFYSEPSTLLFLTIMSQLAHTLQQLIIFCTPGVVVQRINSQNSFYTGSRFIKLFYILQIPVCIIAFGNSITISLFILSQVILVPEQSAFTILSLKLTLFILDAYQNSTLCTIVRAIRCHIIQGDIMNAIMKALYINMVAVICIFRSIDIHFYKVLRSAIPLQILQIQFTELVIIFIGSHIQLSTVSNI